MKLNITKGQINAIIRIASCVDDRIELIEIDDDRDKVIRDLRLFARFMRENSIPYNFKNAK